MSIIGSLHALMGELRKETFRPAEVRLLLQAPHHAAVLRALGIASSFRSVGLTTGAGGRLSIELMDSDEWERMLRLLDAADRWYEARAEDAPANVRADAETHLMNAAKLYRGERG